MLPTLKRDWHWTAYLDLIPAVSFSLAILTRFLDFFLLPDLNKVLVFSILSIYFLISSLFFITPIFKHLFEHPKALLWITVICVVIASIMIFVLPYQNVVLRTVHELNIRVNEESGPVVIGDWSGTYGNPVALEEMTTTGDVLDGVVVLQSRETLSFTREMTGGINFTLSAPEGEAALIVRWDGEEQQIQVQAGSSLPITTDPTAQGKPSTLIRYFALGVKINDWLALFLAVWLVLGFVHLTLIVRTANYKIRFPELQRYLLDYLILSGILLIMVIAERRLFPIREVMNLGVMLLGFIYLMIKLFALVTRALPMIVLCLTIGVNVFANFAWFDEHLLFVRHLSDGSFNELTITVNPYEPTLMSVGFYKQLRGAELIVAPGSFFAEEVNADRLVRIDYVDMDVVDFPDVLTGEDHARLLMMPGWTEWDKRVRGAYYFYKADLPVESPIAIFSYQDDVFLVPIQYTEDLGLFHDFVFD